jgi:hypothetical protein
MSQEKEQSRPYDDAIIRNLRIVLAEAEEAREALAAAVAHTARLYLRVDGLPAAIDSLRLEYAVAVEFNDPSWKIQFLEAVLDRLRAFEEPQSAIENEHDAEPIASDASADQKPLNIPEDHDEDEEEYDLDPQIAASIPDQIREAAEELRHAGIAAAQTLSGTALDIAEELEQILSAHLCHDDNEE